MTSCCCREAVRFVFACSGASDVGEIADRAARRLAYAGLGEMHSLAGICAGDAAIVKEAKAARAMLAIDGCASACANACLERAGFAYFPRIVLADLGLCKCDAPVTPENIERVVAAVRERFGQASSDARGLPMGSGCAVVRAARQAPGGAQDDG